ncbi:BRCA1-A complex subunit Abraxas isoform X2 [Sinocyclocheilus anshuiensis]|uniref:BRCA1-A complex subunit Abraxas isoform X1 n=1 Tax=Sinocyclocheilus anshuiensis TaxID=1608454 RepID=UPI0007B8EAAE|nr:PREDICTED: BRCA1-A complex subunit Abraxas isoform X1 [Sinocyclocheilus anshuiensis]XP_016361769.1 PREDICTED: BRCA1-A complex subunit Abraxas isoform X2 [Sinocyclocheilus anshuiensis]
MEEFNTTVRISGFVLSSLMFHHLNSDADVEGLILGESVGEENCRITDSQIDHIQFEHTINIQKHIPCHNLHSFYSNAGDVSEEKIRQILSDYKEENVIGWYRQRRNSRQQMTFMEQVIHRNMRKILSSQELVFMLLTPSQATASGSTHRLEFSAFIWHSNQYINIPILVSNLGNLEQQDYWSMSGTCPSLGESQAVNRHRTKFFCSGDDLKEVRNISNMNDALLGEMQKVCEEVEKSERAVEKLQEDITQLKEAIRKQKRNSEKNETQKRGSPDEPKENVLLCSALRTLFPDAPSLQTQTLTVQGFPVLELCCNTDHNIDIPTKLPLILENQHTKRKDTAPRLRKKCLVASYPQRLKRKRKTNNTSELASESGSDTEVEMNGQSRSNSPIF